MLREDGAQGAPGFMKVGVEHPHPDTRPAAKQHERDAVWPLVSEIKMTR